MYLSFSEFWLLHSRVSGGNQAVSTSLLILLSNSTKSSAIDYKQRFIRKGKEEAVLVRNAEIPAQLLRGLLGLIELIYLVGH